MEGTGFQRLIWSIGSFSDIVQISLWPLFFGLSDSMDLSTRNLDNAKNAVSPRLSGLFDDAHQRLTTWYLPCEMPSRIHSPPSCPRTPSSVVSWKKLRF